MPLSWCHWLSLPRSLHHMCHWAWWSKKNLEIPRGQHLIGLTTDINKFMRQQWIWKKTTEIRCGTVMGLQRIKHGQWEFMIRLVGKANYRASRALSRPYLFISSSLSFLWPLFLQINNHFGSTLIGWAIWQWLYKCVNREYSIWIAISCHNITNMDIPIIEWRAMNNEKGVHSFKKEDELINMVLPPFSLLPLLPILLLL